MNWPSAEAFFHMGGYGLYVWGSYAMVAAWMLLEPWAAGRRHRAALQMLLDGEQESKQGSDHETAA